MEIYTTDSFFNNQKYLSNLLFLKLTFTIIFEKCIQKL